MENVTNKKDLVRLARLAGIALDEDMLSDYSEYKVISLAFNESSIVIVDNKTGLTYTITYVNGGNPANTFRYITTVEGVHTIKGESLYQVSNGNSDNVKRVIKRRKIENGNRELSFEIIDNVFSPQEDIKCKITYDGLIRRGSKTEHQRLLTKEYRRIDGMTYERVYNFDRNKRLPGDKLDRSTYFSQDGVSYCLDEKNYEVCTSKRLYGFAIENCKSKGAERIFSMQDKYSFQKVFPSVDEEKTKSAMYFEGFVRLYRHAIWIYKDTGGIHLLYSNKETCKNLFKKAQASSYKLNLPVLSPGSISIEEIDEIISALLRGFGEPEFVGMVTHELAEFRKKICINRGLNLKDDMLDPAYFASLSDFEMEETIMDGFSECFEEAERQFDASMRLSLEALDDIKSFRFKPKVNKKKGE